MGGTRTPMSSRRGTSTFTFLRVDTAAEYSPSFWRSDSLAPPGFRLTISLLFIHPDQGLSAPACHRGRPAAPESPSSSRRTWRCPPSPQSRWDSAPQVRRSSTIARLPLRAAACSAAHATSRPHRATTVPRSRSSLAIARRLEFDGRRQRTTSVRTGLANAIPGLVEVMPSTSPSRGRGRHIVRSTAPLLAVARSPLRAGAAPAARPNTIAATQRPCASREPDSRRRTPDRRDQWPAGSPVHTHCANPDPRRQWRVHRHHDRAAGQQPPSRARRLPGGAACPPARSLRRTRPGSHRAARARSDIACFRGDRIGWSVCVSAAATALPLARLLEDRATSSKPRSPAVSSSVHPRSPFRRSSRPRRENSGLQMPFTDGPRAVSNPSRASVP